MGTSKTLSKSEIATILISILALIISILGVFFPYLYVKNSVLFCALPIEHNSNKEIIIPLLFRNDGNREEIILNSVLHLELKTDSKSYFKRISPLKNENFPFMLSPNENIIIPLIGSYKDYFQGLLITDEDSILDYYPVVDYSNLELLINITYISSNGNMNYERKRIAYLSFDEFQNISLIQGESIKLEKLKLNTNYESVRYFSMPKNYERSLSFGVDDSISMKENMNLLKFIEIHLPDSLKHILQKYYSY